MTTKRGSITSSETDSESGADGDTDIARDLYALKVMLDRRLISQADYDARRTELLAQAPNGSCA